MTSSGIEANRLQIGRPSPWLRAFVGLMSVVFWLFTVLPSFDNASQAIHMACIWGLISGFLIANARARLVLRSEVLEVRNLILVWGIPWRRLIGVEDQNGLHLVTSDRGRVGVLAFGSSLLAGLTGNRRSRAIAVEIRQRIVADHEPSEEGTRRSFNYELVIMPLIGLAVYLLSGLVAYNLLHS